MLQVFNNPLLLDYVSVCIKLAPDLREQVEAYNGEPFDVDRVAVGHWSLPGPKWVLKDGVAPLVVAGFEPIVKGVWREWAMFAEEVWTNRHYWFKATRECRKACDAMFSSGSAHRLECLSLASRGQAHRWCEILGFANEGVRVGAAANGADMVVLARVNKSARV